MSVDVPRDDVTIAGAGVAGLALAIALARAYGSGEGITVVDPALAKPAVARGRAYAIAAGPQRFLENLGVWQAIAADAQPIRDMVISDSRPRDLVRPVFLSFEGEVGDGQPFAHMVEEDGLEQALRAAAQAGGVRFVADTVRDLMPEPGAMHIVLGSGALRRSSLLVAADGARSACRALAGIAIVEHDYRQTGIVATIGHERENDGTAYEHFLPAGPFAILPLTNRRCSIVWTESTAEAQRLLALPESDFRVELERRFGYALGALRILSKPAGFPLKLQLARRFVAERIALVGDAAHVVHPIAGQGANLGLRDVEALAAAIVDAARLGLDIGGATTLQAYERKRRAPSVAMATMTDALNRLFANDLTPVRLLRDFGLGVVDRMPGLKARLIGEAAGISSRNESGPVPRRRI